MFMFGVGASAPEPVTHGRFRTRASHTWAHPCPGQSHMGTSVPEPVTHGHIRARASHTWAHPCPSQFRWRFRAEPKWAIHPLLVVLMYPWRPFSQGGSDQ